MLEVQFHHYFSIVKYSWFKPCLFLNLFIYEYTAAFFFKASSSASEYCYFLIIIIRYKGWRWVSWFSDSRSEIADKKEDETNGKEYGDYDKKGGVLHHPACTYLKRAGKNSTE